MLRIAICDDDVIFCHNLEKEILNESKNLGLQANIDVFFDGYTLQESIQKGSRYLIIFIDIDMKQINGIEAARNIRNIDKTVLFIYISGFEQYLKELFEVETFRFLSKPLEKDKFRLYFKAACEKVTESDSFYQYTFNKEIRKVPLKKVVYFESHRRVVTIHLADGSNEEFYGKLNDVETNLLESRMMFLRIHQSFLVNYDYIKRLNFSTVVVIFNNQEIELNISEDRQRNIRQHLCTIADGKALIE